MTMEQRLSHQKPFHNHSKRYQHQQIQEDLERELELVELYEEQRLTEIELGEVTFARGEWDSVQVY